MQPSGSSAPAGFVKVITRGKGERIEGAQIVAPAAGEVIHEFGLAMREQLGLRDAERLLRSCGIEGGSAAIYIAL